MGKSNLTQYLSEFTDQVSAMVYVIRLCHALVNRRHLNGGPYFSLECMEIPPPIMSLANCYMATHLTPTGLL